MSLKNHELASLFPPLPADDLQRLADDIAANGQREPITLYDGRILDGRNRHLACEIAGVEPTYREFDGDDPTAFVLSMNVERRHLDESQRAMIASRLATLRRGRPELNRSRDLITQGDAADRLKVSEPSVKRARKVLDSGDAGLIAAVDSGVLPVKVAAEVAEDPPQVRERIVELANEGMKPQEAKRTARNELIQRPEHHWPEGRYRVLYADPPWAYDSNPVEYQPGVAEHYPTMTVKEIAALPVKESALDDAVLFLWVTAPILAEAFQVVTAWGFTYKASFVWDKVLHNMGHYNSVRHELLLVCTRGACQPDVRKLFDSVYVEERTAHSRKPVRFYEIIDTLYPHGPRVELFARNARDGWERHGYESESA